MRAQTVEFTTRKAQWVRSVLSKVLPRSIAEDRLSALDEYRGPRLAFIRQCAATVIQAYRRQALRAFNVCAFLMQAALVIFCFAASPQPGATGLVLGAVLLALTARNAYTYLSAPANLLDSFGDAVTAGVFVLAAQMLALRVSPSMALPASVLYRNGVVCFALISILHVFLRPKPESGPKGPFEGSGISAVEIYKRTRRLTFLWIATFSGGILMYVSDVQGSTLDFLRGCMPMVNVFIWIAIQRSPLSERDYRMLTDPNKDKLRRMKDTLPQGLKQDEPLYWWHLGLEALIFVQAIVFLAGDLWPWLSGAVPEGFMRPTVRLIGFATTVLTWQHVKHANRAAADALQEEIDAPGAPA